MDPTFIAIAAAMAAGASALVLLALRRPRRSAATRAQLNAVVLNQRLGELERERDIGLLSPAEYEATQEDLRRRVLSEAGEAAGGAMPGGRGRAPLVVAALALPLLSVPIYLFAGSPHLLTTPAAGVMAASAAPVDGAAPDGNAPPAMLTQLEVHVATQPQDGRAWMLLGRMRMEEGQFGAAAVAFERAIEVAPRVARDPNVWCEYADAVGMAQGRTLAGKPRKLIDKALELDANAFCALEMAGSAAVEARDFRAAQDYWSRLLRQIPEDNEQHQQLANALKRIEQRARFALPSPTVPASGS